MTTLVHADIFFFVTTICVVVVAILFVIAWIYIMALLSKFYGIADRIEAETAFVIEELREWRSEMKRKRRFFSLIKMIRNIIQRYA